MGRFAGLSLPSASTAVQAGNKKAWNQERDKASAHFFTVSYSGRTIQAFLSELKAAGISTLVDVRKNPVSMYKPDFSKRNLQSALQAVDIEYLHRPTLGVPREVRGVAIETGSRSVIWDWYDEYVLPLLNLDRFFNMADHPVAFMCVELDPTACHRHRLAVALERHGLLCYDL